MIREVAWRLFAGEYNDSRKELSDGGDRSPSYVLTPLGAKVNRLLVSGVLTDVENLGTEAEPMYRARVSDPTGIYHVYAGQYQPVAAAAIGKISPPAFVMVVGKARTYTTEQGNVYANVRPERIRVVDAAIRDYGVLDSCRFLRKRLELARAAYELEAPTQEALVKLGCSPAAAEGLEAAIQEYGKVDLARYTSMLVEGLRYLIPELRERAEAPATEPAAPTAEGEERVLGLIAALDAEGKGAAWDALLAAAAKAGLEASDLEATIDLLLDRGAIYEPVLGRIKRI